MRETAGFYPGSKYN